MKIYIFFICIFIITSNNIPKYNKYSSPSLAVLPVKLFSVPDNYTDDILSASDYLDAIHSSLLYLEIEVGKSIKNDIKLPTEFESKIKNKKLFLSIFLVIDDFSFYIDDNYFYNEEKNLICRYSSTLSSSYEIKQDLESKYRHSIYASDYFKIYSDITLEKYNLVQIIFRHSLSVNKNISFSCGKAGLLYNAESQDQHSEINFMHQIHSSLNYVDYSFMFKFDESKSQNEIENGLLIIGAESYVKNNEKYELYSLYTKSKNSMSKQEWRFDAEKIIIGNKNLELDGEEFIIKTEIEEIEIPYAFQEIIDNDFFNKYYQKNICVKEELYSYYIVIYCHCKNFTIDDINNFPKIQFSNRDIRFDFLFLGKELFYRKGERYFLRLITRIESNSKVIKLGRIFLRKYNVIFNSDSKMMTFYKISSNKQSIQKMENQNSKNGFLIFLSYAFICILFLLIGFYFGRKFCIFRRKRYANELDDNNYVYETNKKDINSNQKLIEL